MSTLYKTKLPPAQGGCCTCLINRRMKHPTVEYDLMKGFPLSWQSLEKHGGNSTHEYGRIYFSRSTNANCWISQHSWTKKRPSFDVQEKMGQKMEHTFWTMHLDGPKHLGQKCANRWMLTKKMGQKKMVQVSGTKKWINLAATSKHNIHGTKKRDKRY